MKKPSKKIIYIVVGAIFIIGLILATKYGSDFSTGQSAKNLDLPERNDTVPTVPVLYDYGTKIVYTTNTTVSKDVYIDDCSTRGGVFNVCGNTCAPAALTCAATCALTCSITP